MIAGGMGFTEFVFDHSPNARISTLLIKVVILSSLGKFNEVGDWSVV